MQIKEKLTIMDLGELALLVSQYQYLHYLFILKFFKLSNACLDMY